MVDSVPGIIAARSGRPDRLNRYERYRQHYDGDPASSRRLRRNTAHRAPRNYVGLLVDTAVAYLGEHTITWGDGPEAEALEKYLSQVLAAEHRQALDIELETAIAVDGDGFVKVTWDDTAARVRLANVDPAGIELFPHPGDPQVVHAVAQQYQLDPANYPVLFGDTLQPSQTRAQLITEYWSRAEWRVYEGPELRINEPNPYGFIPYVHFPNWRKPYDLYGTSDAKRLVDLQELLNETELDNDTRARLLGLLIVLTGAEGAGDLTVAPGAIWELPEDARAEILDIAKGNLMGQALSYIDALKGEMFQLARIPAAAIGTEEIKTGVSGLALQVQLGPVLREARRKRGYRSPAYEERARMVATLASRFGGEPPPPADARPSAIWSETLPTDRGDELDNALKELALGRSVVAILRDIGIEDPDTEVSARLDEISQGLVQGASHGTGSQPAPAAGADTPDPAA